MRTAASPGRSVPAKTQTKTSEHLGWCYHPSSLYIKIQIKTNLEKKILAFFQKFLN